MRNPIDAWRGGGTAAADAAAAAYQRRVAMQFLARPPRPLSVALVLQTLFGGVLQQMGWLFFGFGMIFVWVFAAQAEIAWSLRAGALGETQARVLGTVDTRASINDTPVYGTRYRFSVGGRDFEAVSYATGRRLGTGQTATVEYSLARPQMSRIRGMRSTMFGPMVLFVLVFPAIGLAFVLGAVPGRLRELHLLRHGLPAHGRLIEKSPTNTRINDRTVYRLRFEYRTRDGRTGQAQARSHEPEELEDEAQEAVLYDPHDLGRAVVFDGMAGKPRVGRDGKLHASAAAAAARLVLPLATLVGHGGWAWLRFLA
ncbi:MAG: DUF3592 domain-containing protein [Sinimarinibacterium flocculans]|uniref:DUF3592 domain-containing protein n=1 Tax=Sinimarinibacterium flocculans TaxID=985250 RepID=UPI003C3E28E0